MNEQRTIYILYTTISKELPDELYKKYLIFLPEILRAQHFRYRRWQDRASNLFSKILLLKGLEKFGWDYTSLEKLKYTEFGKPFLSDQVDFNISHSGQYVVCAVAAGVKLGIDIEEIKNVDFSEFNDLMTAGQWQIINNSKDLLKAFFRFWAIKESVIKADGRGLSVPLNEIVIDGNIAFYKSKWFLKELEFDEHYCAHLATNVANPNINIEYIDIYLLQ